MDLHFSKYQGTGNDFVMVDNRDGKYDFLNLQHIQFLCDRRFGVGADGLIKINAHKDADFEVDYYNADGSKSFCGNGARCSVAFAEALGLDVSKVKFMAIDGEHEAEMQGDLIYLKMNDVNAVHRLGKDFELNTGSPHYIRFVENALAVNVFEEGRKIRYNATYNEDGINVNFVEVLGALELEVATYERGVEGETLSCGTGVTAAALAFAEMHQLTRRNTIEVHTKGGYLKVNFDRKENGLFEQVYLIGPAVKVFEGQIDV